MTGDLVSSVLFTLDELVAELLADVLTGLERRLTRELAFARWLDQHDRP